MGMIYGNKTGQLGWSCPSNIAIIKYWGKRSLQLPLNPSLSMTLDKARTNTLLAYDYRSGNKHPVTQFRFEGATNPVFEDRVSTFIKSLIPHIPVLSHTDLRIESENTFPHSSGIASSASSMGALAMCLVHMELEITGEPDPAKLFEKASFIARLGSGSASRSVYPCFSLWGSSGEWPGSSDEFAIPVKDFHNAYDGMQDSILIVESGSKTISSSQGHAMMETNPFSKSRFEQARNNLHVLKKVLTDGNWTGFIELMEEEALTLHAMMMTSRPGFLLMKPGTISILHKVREFRNDTGLKIGFTLDAGANVHLLYAAVDADRISSFITSELVRYCEDSRVIMDRMGKGPTKL